VRAHRFARVALPIPLGQAFTYRIPEHLDPPAGARVLVELGRRKCLGVIIEKQELPPQGVPLQRIKPLLAVLDEDKALPDELRAFLLELARYYIEPIGEVFRLALPALERATAEELEKSAGKKLKAVGALVQVAEAVAGAETEEAVLPRGSAKRILRHLQEKGPIEVSLLSAQFSTA
jgi:primosomal protein N' (replication factor Y) (superfamily II helicase)